MLLYFLLAALSFDLSSKAAILISADTGAILFEKNSHEKRFPASTTKIAAYLYARSRSPDLRQEIVGNQESLGIVSEKELAKRGYALPSWRLCRGASHMGIKVNEVLTLHDLLVGMMVVSACDASNLIAKTVSGSIPLFIDEMNAYLKEIGCLNTSFLNPHGLYHPEHVSTAYDLAHMTRVALQDPFFVSIVSSKNFIRPKTSLQEAVNYSPTNRLVIPSHRHYYPHAIGVKTGYTSDSGYCLVAAAEKKGRRLVSVVLGAPSNDARYQETIALFEAAFKEKPVKREVLKSGLQETPLDHPSGKKAVVKTVQPLFFETYPSDQEEIQLTFEWFPKSNRGKYLIKNRLGKPKGEVAAIVDHWATPETPPSSNWSWLFLLALPAGILFLFFRRR